MNKFALCLFLFFGSQQLFGASADKIREQIINAAEEPGAVLFTPPEGWGAVDPKVLPSRVKVMVIGKGMTDYPPSINLGMEPYNGTVKDYLKIIKAINESQHAEWKDLGTITTLAGKASLSQVDMQYEWGNVRLMHVILKKSGMLYVLTVAALKDEFPKFYREFFTSMRSFRFNKDAFEMVTNLKKRKQLQKSYQELLSNWQKRVQENRDNASLDPEAVYTQIFESEDFQNKEWKPFEDMLKQDFADMSPVWQAHIKQKIQQEFLVAKSEGEKPTKSRSKATRPETDKISAAKKKEPIQEVTTPIADSNKPIITPTVVLEPIPQDTTSKIIYQKGYWKPFETILNHACLSVSPIWNRQTIRTEFSLEIADEQKNMDPYVVENKGDKSISSQINKDDEEKNLPKIP